VPPDFAEVLAGDLSEEYARRARRGRWTAAAWYLWQVLTLDTGALRRAAETLNGRWARGGGRPGARRTTIHGVAETMMHDLRFALRQLAKRPGFTLVAILSLGLGIGANSALFTAVDALFLQDDGIVEPERVVQIYWNGQSPHWSIAWNWYRGMRDDLGDTFSHVTAYRLRQARTEATGDRVVAAMYTSGDYFGVMGRDMLMGRGFDAGVETDVPDGPPVVVVAYDFWADALGADPDVLDGTLRIDARPHQIVGVLPPDFSGKASGLEVDLFVPDHRAVRNPAADNLVGGARLAEGVSLARAQAALDRLAAGFQAGRDPESTPIAFAMYPESEIRVHPGMDEAALPMVLVLVAVVVMVLVIACTNLASFLLARATDRRREFAVRRALGAARGRVIRQLMTEAFLLALLGAGAGLVAAQVTLNALRAVELPVPVALKLDTGIDLRVLGFTLAVTLVATVLFGIVPSLAAGRDAVASTLRDESTGAGGGRRKGSVRGALVAVQIALSLTLLVGAGLFLRSLLAASSVDPGFERRGIASVTVDPGNSGFELAESRRLLDEALREARALPGVRGAALGTRVPLEPGIWRSGIRRPGVPPPAGRSWYTPQIAYVGGDYFTTLEIELRAGRGILDTDRAETDPVVVVNETLARRLWPDGGDVVGRTVALATHPDRPATVVGVAADTKVASLADEGVPYMYQALRQVEGTQARLLVRVEGAPPEVVARGLRARLKALHPELFVHSATTVTAITDVPYFMPRMATILLSVFGALALALATMGLYGVVSFAVRRREKEMGIRLSLGADPGQVVGLVLRSATRMVGVGVLAGVALGMAGGLVLERFLFGVRGLDPVTLVVVPTLLVSVAYGAAWIPARRASKVDPVQSLRSQ
jgi:predicted permease